MTKGTVVIRLLRPEFKFPTKIDLAFFSNVSHQMIIKLIPTVFR